jgi:hypothetical protein
MVFCDVVRVAGYFFRGMKQTAITTTQATATMIGSNVILKLPSYDSDFTAFQQPSMACCRMESFSSKKPRLWSRLM